MAGRGRTLTPPKIVIHTDVLLGHLVGQAHPSDFRRVLGLYFCYTTVFQAIELFSLVQSAAERKMVEDMLSVVKILGVNGRSAPQLAAMITDSPGKGVVDALIAGICRESRLPLLTARREQFERFPGLVLIHPGTLNVPPDNSDRA